MPMIGFATLLSLLFVLVGVLSIRFGVLPFGLSFATYGLGLVGCAMLMAAVGALIARRLARKQALAKLPLWLVLCFLPVALVVNQVGLAGFQVPPIHDISTDLANPPVFVFAQAERGPGENSLDHEGEVLSELQSQGYPQLTSLHLSASKVDVWAAVMTVIVKNNWRVLGEDKARGHIEAVAITRMMGFADDVVIRISADVDDKNTSDKVSHEKSAARKGVVVDVRSVSRVGESDLGANAARIKSFFKALQNQLKN
ncbi:MAG: hypothetical protein COA75_08250 [Cellvibrionales bacterium]|nr:MAG: hypothetical protein COA75_08250 [Cellvibrionales bacterium]